MACCVKHCKSVKRLVAVDSNISFHRVPKKEFKTYMSILDLPKEPYKIKYICSLHFVPEDFVLSKMNMKLLKKNVKPTVNIANDLGGNKNLTDRRNDESDPSTSQGAKPCTTLAYIREVSEKSSPLKSESAPFQTPLYQPVRRSGQSSSSTLSASTPEKQRFSSHLQFEWSLPVPKSSDSEGSSLSETYSKAKESSFNVSQKPRSPQSPPLKTQSDASSSLSEGTEEDGLTEFVKAIHSYSINPKKIKRKLEESQKKLVKSSKQLYVAKKTIHKLRQKISSLIEIIEALKNERMLSESALDHLERTTAGIPKVLLQSYLNNVGMDSI